MSFDINKDISKASIISKDFYLNPKYYDDSLEKIFPNSWQFIVDTDSFEKNSIYPFTFLPNSIEEPLLIVGDKNKFQCLSNVCTHRAHLIIDKPCSKKKLRCKYHGRTFNMDGQFHSAPGFEKTKFFPQNSDNLNSVPLIKWNKFIFASLEGKIDITPVLEDITTRLPNYPFDKLFFDSKNSQSWEINTHWALYCENYVEGFHVPFVHKGLSKEMDIAKYKTKLLPNSVLQIAECDSYFSVFDNKNSDIKYPYAFYYWVFPNMMLNFYSWGLSINIIEPLSNKKTRIRFLSYSFNNTKQPQSGDASLNTVELEDQSVVLSVQRGIKSRLYQSGRYSADHELGLHHFHLLLEKTLSI